MNASDILKYGHLTFCRAFESIPDGAWETKGVCGIWSVKNIVAHVAAYELVVSDIFSSFLDPKVETPYLSILNGTFNDSQVDLRKSKSPAETRDEYQRAHAHNVELITRISDEARREVGRIPWYGPEYALDDLIVYTVYGHKREHSAQIHHFRDSL